jgi:hypothetical protein
VARRRPGCLFEGDSIVACSSMKNTMRSLPIRRQHGEFVLTLTHSITVIPAPAGIQIRLSNQALENQFCSTNWIPACAGMTN